MLANENSSTNIEPNNTTDLQLPREYEAIVDILGESLEIVVKEKL